MKPLPPFRPIGEIPLAGRRQLLLETSQRRGQVADSFGIRLAGGREFPARRDREECRAGPPGARQDLDRIQTYRQNALRTPQELLFQSTAGKDPAASG